MAACRGGWSPRVWRRMVHRPVPRGMRYSREEVARERGGEVARGVANGECRRSVDPHPKPEGVHRPDAPYIDAPFSRWLCGVADLPPLGRGCEPRLLFLAMGEALLGGGDASPSDVSDVASSSACPPSPYLSSSASSDMSSGYTGCTHGGCIMCGGRALREGEYHCSSTGGPAAARALTALPDIRSSV